MLISDFYANWQMHLAMLDVSKTAKTPTAVRAQLEDVLDPAEQTDGHQTTDGTSAIIPPERRFRRHGQTITMLGEDIELTEQLADLLEGLLNRPDG